MRVQVSIHEAKTQLSKLIAAVERGEEVVIARRDKLVVSLNLHKPTFKGTLIGCVKDDEFRMTAKFDDPALNAEIAGLFNGE